MFLTHNGNAGKNKNQSCAHENSFFSRDVNMRAHASPGACEAAAKFRGPSQLRFREAQSNDNFMGEPFRAWHQRHHAARGMRRIAAADHCAPGTFERSAP
jgi:hypothetical protein